MPASARVPAAATDPDSMNLVRALVAESFVPPAADLDFDAVGAPRRLLPRPVGTDPETWRALRADLAWFWNSNADWAEEQVAVAADYRGLVGPLVAAAAPRPGDRVVLSASEPDSRRAAWGAALPEGVEIADWRPRPGGGLDPDDLEPLLDERTRFVLQTKACPVTGALNEVIPVAQRLAGAGIPLFVEASHFAAHGSLDLRNLRCDAVLVDGGELFGAGGAARWARQRPAASGGDPGERAGPELPPGVLAGLVRVVRYVERLGESPGGPVAPPSERFGRREAMRRGMQGIRQEERVLSRHLLRGLAETPGVRVLGEADPWRAAHRTPAVTFTTGNGDAAALAAALREAGAEVAAGDLGASGVLAALGADPGAGAVRASLAHYHSLADIDRFVALLRRFA